MPLGNKNVGTSTGAENGERPIVFQQYFKNGNRTYASQVKISQTGRKYLVLTEGHRDSKTQELKKHTIYVFEQDLKQFFAILQETVLYLRSAKDSASTAASTAEKPAPASGPARPAKPPIAVKAPPAAKAGSAKAPVAPRKPPTSTKAPAPAKPVLRPGTARTSTVAVPAAKAVYRTGNRASSRQGRA